MRLLISKEDSRQFLITDISKPFHSQFGMFSVEDISKPDGSVIKSNKGKEFVILSPSFIDVFKRLKKMPQSMPLKDIGFIIGETGINSESVVLDAGSGSGHLSAALAHLVKKVITYEVNQDYLENIRENFRRLDLQNVELRVRDVREGFDEMNVDLITLDMPDADKVVPHAANALKIGGFLVNYALTVMQLSEFVEAVQKDSRLFVIKSSENLERLWVVEGRKVRPKNTPIGHSGFLTVVRKVCK